MPREVVGKHTDYAGGRSLLCAIKFEPRVHVSLASTMYFMECQSWFLCIGDRPSRCPASSRRNPSLRRMRQNDMARRMEVSLQFKAGDKVHRLHRLVAVVEQKGLRQPCGSQHLALLARMASLRCP